MNMNGLPANSGEAGSSEFCWVAGAPVGVLCTNLTAISKTVAWGIKERFGVQTKPREVFVKCICTFCGDDG
jgi:hypothetical protein